MPLTKSELATKENEDEDLVFATTNRKSRTIDAKPMMTMNGGL
jgi:hypothetical protein